MKYCGLLGKNITYTKSPDIHNEYYKKNNINLKYEVFDLNENEITSFIESLREKNVVGFNITIPYKELILQYIDRLEYPANIINAANTVLVKGNELIGFNTDYFGFIMSLKEEGIELLKKDCLIIGAGGSAKCVYTALKDLGADNIDIAARKPLKVSKGFFKEVQVLSIESIKDISKYDFIVNCTPAGGPNQKGIIPIRLDELKKETVVYDLNYIPKKTKLLEKSERLGAKVINGELMLKYQAYKAANIWIEYIVQGG